MRNHSRRRDAPRNHQPACETHRETTRPTASAVGTGQELIRQPVLSCFSGSRHIVACLRLVETKIIQEILLYLRV